MLGVVRTSVLRLNSRRYRRIVVACLATLTVSGGVLGIVLLMRSRTERAVEGDTRVVLTQAAQQLLRAFHSRRGTLTLLRDTLDRAPELQPGERQALAASAVNHTRHLLGVGAVREGQPLSWWATPGSVSPRERAALSRALAQRARLRHVWKVPSTFSVSTDPGRPLLVMLEPLRAKTNQRSAIVGAFDVKPLLTDFFELTLQQPYPVQLIAEGQVLYQSLRWQGPSDGRQPDVIDQPIQLDAVDWTLRMQPGTTQAVRAISWVTKLLMLFGLIGGLSAIGLIWVLAMRTWILQRAVARRTAALRRTTDRLRQLAITDELTGLYNRRFFLERWEWECDRAKRYRRPLGCLMIDVDKFKRVNDVLGHVAGDQLLKEVAQNLRAQLRQSDILARFGGDEFIVALPETTKAQADAVAEKLRQLAIDGPWSRHAHIGPVRLSVGLSHIQGEDTAQDVIQHADANLYASRQHAQMTGSQR